MMRNKTENLPVMWGPLTNKHFLAQILVEFQKYMIWNVALTVHNNSGQNQ